MPDSFLLFFWSFLSSLWFLRWRVLSWILYFWLLFASVALVLRMTLSQERGNEFLTTDQSVTPHSISLIQVSIRFLVPKTRMLSQARYEWGLGDVELGEINGKWKQQSAVMEMKCLPEKTQQNVLNVLHLSWDHYLPPPPSPQIPGWKFWALIAVKPNITVHCAASSYLMLVFVTTWGCLLSTACSLSIKQEGI